MNNGALLQISSIVERELSGSGNSRLQSQSLSASAGHTASGAQALHGRKGIIVDCSKATELLENLDKAVSQDPRVKSWSQGYWGHEPGTLRTPD